MHTTTFKGEQVELHCTNGKCLIFLSLRVARWPPHIAIRGAIPPLRPSAETSGNSVSHHHAGPSPLRGGARRLVLRRVQRQVRVHSLTTMAPPNCGGGQANASALSHHHGPPPLRGGASPPPPCRPPPLRGGVRRLVLRRMPRQMRVHSLATMAPPHCGGGPCRHHQAGPPPLRGGGAGTWCYGNCRGKCECTLSPPWPPPHCGGGPCHHHHAPPIAGGHIWSLWKIQKQVLVHPLPPFFEDASDCGGGDAYGECKGTCHNFSILAPLIWGGQGAKKKILGLPCILHMWRMHGSAIAHMVYIIFVIHTHIYIYIYICVGVFLSTHTNISRPPMINWGPQKLTLN